MNLRHLSAFALSGYLACVITLSDRSAEAGDVLGAQPAATPTAATDAGHDAEALCRRATDFDAAEKLKERERAKQALDEATAKLAAAIDELVHHDGGADGGADDAATLREHTLRVADAKEKLALAQKSLVNADDWARWYDTCLDYAANARDNERENALGLGLAGGYSRGADEKTRITLSFMFSHQPRPRYRLEYRALIAKETLQSALGAGIGGALVYGRTTGLYLGMDATIVSQHLHIAPRLGVAFRPLWGLAEAPDRASAWADARLFLQPVLSTQEGGSAMLFGFEIGAGRLFPP